MHEQKKPYSPIYEPILLNFRHCHLALNFPHADVSPLLILSVNLHLPSTAVSEFQDGVERKGSAIVSLVFFQLIHSLQVLQLFDIFSPLKKVNTQFFQ